MSLNGLMIVVIKYGKNNFKLISLITPKNSKKSKCQASISFAIKSELKNRPYIILTVLMTTTILYLGYAMRVFEMY